MHSLRREISELYATITIKNFAFSMMSIFEPIFIYNQFHSLSAVFLFYAAVYLFYFISLPLGAKAASKYGFEHCIFYSVPFAIFYFLTLSQIPNNKTLMIFSILFVVAYKTLFWPSYHSDFAHYSRSGYRGREISMLSFVSTMATVIGPVLGGIIISTFGFRVLFVIVSMVSLVSIIPIFTTREKFHPHTFSYSKAFERIYKPSNHYKPKDFLAYLGFGEEIISVVAWPIFVYLLIDKYYLMGIIMSVLAIILALITLYVGKLSDILNIKGRRKLLNSSEIIRFLSWLLRPFASNWLGVILIDTISSGAKIGINYPILTGAYNKGDSHRGFLEYVIYFEMSLALGKFIIAIISAVIASLVTGFYMWFSIFSLAGFWSLLFLFRYKKT